MKSRILHFVTYASWPVVWLASIGVGIALAQVAAKLFVAAVGLL